MALGRDTGLVRQHNRAIVLELLRTKGPLSRPALAQRGGVSRPTVLEIAADLKREGLIREVGYGPSTGGRRPVLLELVPEAQCAIGLRIGLRAVTGVITDLRAAVRRRAEVPFSMRDGPRLFAERSREVLDELILASPGGWAGVRGIGVAFPAPVLANEPLTILSPRYPAWEQFPLREWLASTYGVPVLVDNNANTAALGEHFFGAGRGVEHMLYVLISQGIGGGVIIDGRLYRGAAGGAGELGHMTFDVAGPRCDCGKSGCWQLFAGADAVAGLAKRTLILAGRDDLAGRPLADLSVDDVIDAAEDGDDLAIRVLEQTGRYLGVGLANAAQVLNPGLIVLGGPVARAGHRILAPAVEVARQQTWPGLADRVRVVLGHLGEDAEAIGAAVLLLRDLFRVAIPDDGALAADQNGRSGRGESATRASPRSRLKAVG